MLYGPSKMLGLPEDWHLMLIGLILVGFVISLCIIPALPEMIRSVEKDFDNSKGEVNDVASGVFNTSLGVGQVLGPLFGSILTSWFSFRDTTDIIGIGALIFATIYFIFGGGWSALAGIFFPTTKEDKLLEKFSMLNGHSGEIEMHNSYNYRGPINDYFNRSLSEQSIIQISKKLNKSHG